MKLESFIIEIIEKRRSNFFTKGLQWILFLLSQFFEAGVFCKNFLYDRGVFKSQRVSVPVVSIGNIVAGGTGKTSFISFIASQLKTTKLSILSRGYRSKIAHTNAVMEVSNGIGPLYSVDICGDEPFLLSNLIPNATILVGRDRVKAAKMATELKSKLILLDDGMQHRKLHREVEVVLLHADDPFGKNAFLPRGYLRDHPKRLKNADLVVVHGLRSLNQLDEILPKVEQFTSSPIIGTKIRVDQIFAIDTKEVLSVEGAKVGVFCSIGKPMSFVETLKNKQCDVIKHLFFPDHAKFRKEEIFSFAKSCKDSGAKWILCTEKDGVKISNYRDCPVPIGVVKTSLEVVRGKEELDSFIQKIETLGGR